MVSPSKSFYRQHQPSFLVLWDSKHTLWMSQSIIFLIKTWFHHKDFFLVPVHVPRRRWQFFVVPVNEIATVSEVWSQSFSRTKKVKQIISLFVFWLAHEKAITGQRRKGSKLHHRLPAIKHIGDVFKWNHCLDIESAVLSHSLKIQLFPVSVQTQRKLRIFPPCCCEKCNNN